MSVYSSATYRTLGFTGKELLFMTISLRSALVGLVLLAPGLCTSIARAAAPDAGLYTGYYLSSDYTGVTFIVCGSVPGSDGCYGFGTLGPFGHIGAMVEGNGKIVGSVVNHDIYVVDVAGGANGKEVILNSYTLTNTVNPPYDTVTYELTKQLSLPLSGGKEVRCSLADNGKFLFVGTDKSTSAVVVAKDGYAVTSVGGFSNNPTVAAITTDNRGYVIVAFGANSGGPGGNVDFGPDGTVVSDGGGAWFLVPTTQGISSKDVPTLLGSEPADTRLSIHLRSAITSP
jgi:hypothetical protein